MSRAHTRHCLSLGSCRSQKQVENPIKFNPKPKVNFLFYFVRLIDPSVILASAIAALSVLSHQCGDQLAGGYIALGGVVQSQPSTLQGRGGGEAILA